MSNAASGTITFGDGAYDAFASAVGNMGRARMGGTSGAGYIARITLDNGDSFDAEIVNDITFAKVHDGDPALTGEIVRIDPTDGPFVESVHIY